MQNEFEKQVQQKMEELDFVPSAPVWQKIEEKIREKKDRRRLVLWIPLLLAFLAGGIWWLNEGTGKNNLTAEEVGQPITDQHRTEKNTNNNPANTTNTTSTTNTTTTQPISKTTPALIRKQKSFTTTEPSISIKTQQSKTDLQQTENTGAQTTDSHLKTPPATEDVSAANEETKKAAVPATEEVKEEIKKDSIAANEIKTIKKVADTKWKLGITGGLGISHSGSGISLFAMEKDLNPYQSPTSSPGLSNPAASPVNKGLSWSLGVVAVRQLGKRSSFSAGLQYDFYSTRIEVGKKMKQDTTLAGSNLALAQFYTNTTSDFHNYCNKFHYLSLPLAINVQLLRNIPLNMSAGLSLQQLVKTNALQYNDQSKIYYFDKNAFNRTQVFTSFGINYSVPLDKMAVVFGPQIQYALSRMEKNGSSSHLYTIGLKAQLLFQKK